MFHAFLFLVEKARKPRLGRGKKRANMPGYMPAINSIGRRYWKPINTVKRVYQDKQDYIRDQIKLGDVVKRRDRNVVVLARLKDSLVTFDPIGSRILIDDFKEERNIVVRESLPNFLTERPNLLRRSVISNRFTVADVLRHPDNWARMQQLKQSGEVNLPTGFELGDRPDPRFKSSTQLKKVDTPPQPQPEQEFLLNNGFLPFGGGVPRKTGVDPVKVERVKDKVVDISGWKKIGENKQQGIQESHWIEDPNGQLHLNKRNEVIISPELVITPSAVGERMASVIGQAVGVPVNEVLVGRENGKHTSIHKALEGTRESSAETLVSLPKEVVAKHLSSPEAARIAVFDTFMLNGDRHHGNLMEDKKGRLFAIDNSFCYPIGFITDRMGADFSKDIFESIVNNKMVSVFRLFAGEDRKFTSEQRTAAMETWGKLANLTDRQLENWITELPDELFNVPTKYSKIPIHYDKSEILEHYKKRRDEFKVLNDSLISE